MSIVRLDARLLAPEALRGGIVALGNFDGFHLGHQAVAGHAVEWARAEGRPAIIATFDPHPMRYFAPDSAPFRLTTLDQRQRLFAAAGADAMLVFEFGDRLASTSAEDFVTDLLARRLGVVGVVTGDDFSFGKGRAGNVGILRELGARCGIRTETVGPVLDGGKVISSSRIRAALIGGDPVEAARLMTRPFAVEGVVVPGARLGRELGFPTANIEMGNYLRPRFGIYAVTATLPDGRELKGAANLGIRPSFDPPLELLEPHFFDFAGDLYGQTIEVAFRHFLRPEAKYEGLEPLKAQIAIDCEDARRLLA